jgi:glycosyltransferase involved in cell wall biosynthesis
VTVVGDGAQRERFEELEQQYATLEVTGRLPDETAFEHLARASIAINPQHTSELQRSSSPVKLYYYAAMGKPMVVSEGPPLVDTLVEADAALGTGSRNKFVENVDRLLSDTELATRLRENALDEATEFTWDVRAESVVSIYE